MILIYLRNICTNLKQMSQKQSKIKNPTVYCNLAVVLLHYPAESFKTCLDFNNYPTSACTEAANSPRTTLPGLNLKTCPFGPGRTSSLNLALIYHYSLLA